MLKCSKEICLRRGRTGSKGQFRVIHKLKGKISKALSTQTFS